MYCIKRVKRFIDLVEDSIIFSFWIQSVLLANGDSREITRIYS